MCLLNRSGVHLILLCLLQVIVPHSSGQTSTGIQPFGSYRGFDNVNLADLSVHLDIPLFTHQSRGSSNGVSVHLLFGGAPSGDGPDGAWSIVASTGGSGGINVLAGPTNSCTGYGPGGTYTGTQTQYFYAFTDKTGFVHPFDGYSRVANNCGSGGQTTSLNELAVDGSGYLLAATGQFAVVTDPSGTTYTAGSAQGTSTVDSNGNKGSQPVTQGPYPLGYYGTLTDSSNITATLSGGAYHTDTYGVLLSRSPAFVTYTDTLGNSQTVTINYKLYNVYTVFNQYSTGYQTYAFVDSVQLADKSSYQFTYAPSACNSSYVAGYLGSVQLPTGGIITYQYTDPSSCSFGTSSTSATLSRATPDGTTTYSKIVDSVNSNSLMPTASHTNITNADGNNEQINFVYYNGGFSNTSTLYHYETSHVWSGAGGTALKTTMRCYNGASGDCTTLPVTPPFSQITTTTTLDNVTTKTVEQRNANGLVTETDEYDFGAATPIRKTITSYASLGNNIADRPLSIMTLDASGTVASQTTYGYDEFSLTPTTSLPGHDTVSGARGNRTSQHAWVGAAGNTLDSHWSYDDAGQVRAAQDPRLNWTYYGYDSATDLCLISTTPPSAANGVSQATSGTCDPYTGLVASTTDANGVSKSYSYDLMLRPTGTSSTTSTGTLAASMTRSYSGPTLPETLTETVSASPSPDQVSTTVLDGLGRVATATAPGGAKVDTTYNSMGNIQSVSNPYLSLNDPTYGLTSYLYDALGRKTYQCQPDNSNTASTTCTPANSYRSWSYIDNTVTFRDEVGNQHKQLTDGLGRLTTVWEPSATSQSPSMETDYTYDTLNNLRSVTQWGGASGSTGARTRSFTYDSLSRLLTAQNPETGLICYGTVPTGQTPSATNCTSGYDPNGNLQYKTDARGVTTNFSYDALNRLTDKTYTIPVVNQLPVASATPSVHYTYDATSQTGAANIIGRLTGETVQQGSSVLYQRTVPAYNPMGRVATDMRCVPGFCSNLNTMTYQYGLAGQETSGTIDKTVFVYTYDSAGRMNAEGLYTTDGTQSYNLMTNVQYSPFGSVSSTDNYETRSYDVRGRTKTVAYTGGFNYNATYDYYLNGNLFHANDSTIGNWAYGYDSLNRLSTATSQDPTVGTQTYSYDSFGNKLSQNGVLSHSATFSTVTNRDDCNGCYDAAGNIVQDVQAVFPHNYSYDAEGRLSGITDLGYQYLYDGEGERVAVLQKGAYTKEYLHEANGQFYSIFDGTGAETSVEVFGAGRHILTLSDDFYFTQLDAQGTERGRFGFFSGVKESCTNLPFGDGLSCDHNDPGALHFTGKERDTESGLDYFGARYMSSSMGRFMSPDSNPAPDPIPYADITNPQSLNLYSYVLNNPIANTDPDGHDCIDTTNLSKDGTVTVTAGTSCANNLGPNGTYINGTVNTSSLTTDGKGSVGYSFTSYDGQNGGGGVISPAAPYGPLEGPANLAGTNMIGNGGMAAIGEFVKQSALSALAEGIGQGIGIGIDALQAARAAKAADAAAQATSQAWKFGAGKSATKWANQLLKRGWTEKEISEAIASGERYPAVNNINPANGATRYVSASSGKSVVVDNVTQEVIHVGGSGFSY